MTSPQISSPPQNAIDLSTITPEYIIANKKDYYAVLGLTKAKNDKGNNNACCTDYASITTADIQRNYRRLALRIHPDKQQALSNNNISNNKCANLNNFNNIDVSSISNIDNNRSNYTTEAFIILNEAYSTLKNSQSRQFYDYIGVDCVENFKKHCTSNSNDDLFGDDMYWFQKSILKVILEVHSAFCDGYSGNNKNSNNGNNLDKENEDENFQINESNEDIGFDEDAHEAKNNNKNKWILKIAFLALALSSVASFLITKLIIQLFFSKLAKLKTIMFSSLKNAIISCVATAAVAIPVAVYSIKNRSKLVDVNIKKEGDCEDKKYKRKKRIRIVVITLLLLSAILSFLITRLVIRLVFKIISKLKNLMFSSRKYTIISCTAFATVALVVRTRFFLLSISDSNKNTDNRSSSCNSSRKTSTMPSSEASLSSSFSSSKITPRGAAEKSKKSRTVDSQA